VLSRHGQWCLKSDGDTITSSPHSLTESLCGKPILPSVLPFLQCFDLVLSTLCGSRERATRDGQALGTSEREAHGVGRHGEAELSLPGSWFVYILRDVACDHVFKIFTILTRYPRCLRRSSLASGIKSNGFRITTRQRSANSLPSWTS
jgi:hypothetical protein